VSVSTHERAASPFDTLRTPHDERCHTPRRPSASRCHRYVVERQHAVTDHLVLLVPLAADEHEIARLRDLDRLRNRHAPVDDRQHRLRVVSPRVRGDAALDLFDDSRGILAPRVV